MTVITAKMPGFEREPAVGDLPRPTGYHLLIYIPETVDKTAGGIMLTDEAREREQYASPIAMVMAMGPSAYKDKTKFPDGPWCEEGDWILMRSYSGRSFWAQIDGKLQEFRTINDDQVDAVVPHPGLIVRRK